MKVSDTLFKDKAQYLAPILQRRYAVTLGMSETVTLEGTLTISGSMGYDIFLNLAKLIGKKPLMLGKDIPVTVHFRTNETANELLFERIFYFEDKAPYELRSKMIILKDNIVVEMMSKRLGCRLRYDIQDNEVLLNHDGYCLKIGQRFYSLPLTWLLGKASAIEQPLNDDAFYLRMKVKHFTGTIVGYEGEFTVSSTSQVIAVNPFA